MAELERVRALGPEEERGLLLEEVAPPVREAATARGITVLRESGANLRDGSSAFSRARRSAHLKDLVGEFTLVPIPIPRDDVKGADHWARGAQHLRFSRPPPACRAGRRRRARDSHVVGLRPLGAKSPVEPYWILSRTGESIRRIDEVVSHTREMLGRQPGNEAWPPEVAEVETIPPELAELFKRLRLFRGGSEDALSASVRLTGLAATMAAELRADVRITRRAALLAGSGSSGRPRLTARPRRSCWTC